MFPFRTNRHKIFSDFTDDEIKSCLKKHIKEKRRLQITNDFQFYGNIQSNYSKFELGHFPSRNAFRPIVVLTWNEKDLVTEINSYLRFNNRMTIFVLILPLFGIYFSFEHHFIIPFIITLLLTLFLIFGLFQVEYIFSKKLTLEKLDIILKELKGNSSNPLV